MSERTVVLGLMSYLDEKGAHRVGYAGDVVTVHPDHLARFDRLNVLAGQEPEELEVVSEVAEPEPTLAVEEQASEAAESEPAPKTRARKAS